ncbi:uncharacterized protein [Maniola hyperantus]|uniref:uncharacterized protein n=1 Tax=Aphantopus hyperantus TaxID=2795564 RepID=UPI0037490657
MENELRNVRIGPLPGGRQGAPGAGAGRSSIRAASTISRPAPPPSRSTHPSSPPDGLAPTGSARAQSSAPAAGGVRRMRWTSLMNENVMRAYYRATGGETGRTGYRAAMYREFLLLEPNLTVTEQNLADRARYIQRSNIFNATELERLRREAVPEVSAPTTEQIVSQAARPSVREETITTSQDLPVEEDTEETVSLDIERMRRILEETISEIRSAPLENRPRLSRLTLNVATRDVIEAIKKMLPQHLESSTGLGDTASILFGAALAVHRFIGAKTPGPGRAAAARRSAEPAWKKRIERRITLARVLIGRLQSFRSGNTRPRIVRSVRVAFNGCGVRLDQPDIAQKLTERIDDLKQKIAAWGNRIRRYSERVERFQQNRLFLSDQKRFYKRLECPAVCSASQRPDPADLVTFWRGVWSREVEHEEGPWIAAIEEACASIEPMNPIAISTEDVAGATLTSVLSLKISRHVDENNIISGAQNGCRGGSRGTKELLLIDSVAGQLVKRNRRNFSAAWIDYRKAFDSVPHSWLLRVLELYKVDGTVRDFLGECMGQWSTILCLHGERLADADDRIRIGRGIFQGDCLSPLWFCLSLNPLSTLLEGSGTGFQFRRGGTKVPHLLYMDDLKLLAPNATRLQELLNVTTDFSNSIRMELGLDKCAVMHVERGQVTHSAEMSLEPSTIRTLSEAESYRGKSSEDTQSGYMGFLPTKSPSVALLSALLRGSGNSKERTPVPLSRDARWTHPGESAATRDFEVLAPGTIGLTDQDVDQRRPDISAFEQDQLARDSARRPPS